MLPFPDDSGWANPDLSGDPLIMKVLGEYLQLMSSFRIQKLDKLQETHTFAL